MCEIGIRGGLPGALAERLAVPVTALHPLPGRRRRRGRGAGRAGRQRAALGLGRGACGRGERVLVLGPGTIGLLVALFALAQGAEVHVLGLTRESLDFAAGLGVHGAWTAADLPRLPFDAVIDASNSPELPALALELVEPARRVVFIGAGRAARAPSTPGRWC